MRILLDVDGVVGDLVGAICRHLPGRVEEDFTEYAIDAKLTPVERQVVEALAHKPGFALSIPVYSGSREFVRQLSDYGAVYFLTAPWHSATWESERREWVSFHFERPTISCPAVYKHLISGDVLIEDRPETLLTWSDDHPRGSALLMDRPWNRSARGYRRVRSYAEVIDVLRGVR